MPYKNKEDQVKYAQKHYNDNKELYNKRRLLSNRKIKQKSREFINDYLKANPCVDCGESDPIVLEFDHVFGDKKYNVADLLKGYYAIETIKLEIKKCEVRCANCHRRVTHNRRINNLLIKK
jgi:hypothetical protein